jgi:hypothetical protein
MILRMALIHLLQAKSLKKTIFNFLTRMTDQTQQLILRETISQAKLLNNCQDISKIHLPILLNNNNK